MKIVGTSVLSTSFVSCQIKEQLKYTLKETDFSNLGELYRGKVRDNYITPDQRIIVATDRLSAFDRVITTIPFKGQMLNQVSSFWFEKTKDIVKNHIIDIPDPNVAVVHQCKTVPVEVIALGRKPHYQAIKTTTEVTGGRTGIT